MLFCQLEKANRALMVKRFGDKLLKIIKSYRESIEGNRIECILI